MRLLTFASSFFIYPSSFGQTSQYQNLLDTALKGHEALFVYSKPISALRLDKSDMWEYAENLRDQSKQSLDTIMFFQIIQNSKTVDTSFWKDYELPFSLLVQDRDESFSKKYAIQKLALTDKKQIKFYREQINKFNSTETYDRNINCFSRPIFDNSKRFAIVQWDNGHSGLSGGGEIVLYQLLADTWKEVGIIMNWRY